MDHKLYTANYFFYTNVYSIRKKWNKTRKVSERKREKEKERKEPHIFWLHAIIVRMGVRLEWKFQNHTVHLLMIDIIYMFSTWIVSLYTNEIANFYLRLFTCAKYDYMRNKYMRYA
jgi:K+-sensing histidine kinase KdpD